MGIGDEKSELRSRYRRERNERYTKDDFAHLLNSPEVSQANVVASYMSYGDEPATHQLNTALLEAGKIVLLPRINKDAIDWVQWDGDSHNLQQEKKILEPKGPVFTDIGKIEVVIVPALRIDRHGYRLGQGGGYYDRTLPLLAAWSVGLVHSHEISQEDLPREPWDIPLFAAATPEEIIRFEN